MTVKQWQCYYTSFPRVQVVHHQNSWLHIPSILPANIIKAATVIFLLSLAWCHPPVFYGGYIEWLPIFRPPNLIPTDYLSPNPPGYRHLSNLTGSTWVKTGLPVLWEGSCSCYVSWCPTTPRSELLRSGSVEGRLDSYPMGMLPFAIL